MKNCPWNPIFGSTVKSFFRQKSLKPKLRIEEARKARKKPCFLSVTKPMCSEWDCNIYLHWSQTYARRSHVGQNIPVPFEAFWETQNTTKKNRDHWNHGSFYDTNSNTPQFFGGEKFFQIYLLNLASTLIYLYPTNGSNWMISPIKIHPSWPRPNAPPGPVTFRRWSLHQNSLPEKGLVWKRWQTGKKLPTAISLN